MESLELYEKLGDRRNFPVTIQVKGRFYPVQSVIESAGEIYLVAGEQLPEPFRPGRSEIKDAPGCSPKA